MVSFPFFVYLVTILCCSNIVWSKDLSAYFFCFLLILDQEFSFLFLLSSTLLIGNFLFLLSSDSFDRKFSPFLLFSSFLFLFLFSFEGKVYGELGLWLKACRADGHDICQGADLVQGYKGMSHIISMTEMQQ